MGLFLLVSSPLLFCTYLHLTFTNSGATSLSFQCGVQEGCYASGASQRAQFSVKLCHTMLSYDKELVKTKNNINVHSLFAFLYMEFIFSFENFNVTATEASVYYQ